MPKNSSLIDSPYLFKCFRVEEYIKEGLDKKVIGPESGANGAETAYAGREEAE